MPLKTPYYNLEAFLWGEPYSSTADRRRFTTVDNQLGFLSDMIGDGRISGWSVSVEDLATRTLSISSGMGIIGRKVLLSFGEFQFQLLNNVTEYVYMREKLGQIGGFSNFSNMASIKHSDEIPPGNPFNLVAVSSLITFEQITFQWDANTEVDFSHYIIKKSADEIYGGFEEIAQTTDTIYTDSGLLQDTEYSYQVVAVDLSGNESRSIGITISTLPDLRIPVAPIFFQLFNGDQSIQAIWDNSPSENVDSYKLDVEELDANGNTVYSFSVPSIAEQPLDSTTYIIEELNNNIDYKVTLYAVNINGVLSAGLVKFALPVFSPGAGEVHNVDISFSSSQFEEVGIEADLSWDYLDEDDPYEGVPNLFRITFIENGDRPSEPIDVLSVSGRFSYTSTIRFLPYLDENNEQVFESFKEYTSYILVIQTVDVDGNVSTGIIRRINKTPTFETLPAVTDLNTTRNVDDSIAVNWKNPFSQFFDYIELTVTVTDLATGDEVVAVDNVNIGKSTTHTVANSFFGKNKRYNFIFVPVDIFGVAGEPLSSATQFLDQDTERKPEPPQNISTLSADGSIKIQWVVNYEEISNIEFFKIYRAVNQIFVPSEDFSLLAVISSSSDSFIDFTAQKDVTYIYLVTSVDFFGNESVNPVADGLIPGLLPIATIKDSFIVTEPTGLLVSGSGHDAVLTWDSEVSDFDGYEIYRSSGNNYSFELVGFVLPTVNTFTDSDSMLIDGITYYYLVRKYRNEVSPFVTSSTVAPSNSIILASVITSDAGITIDNTLARELENFEDPIIEKTQLKLDVHKHIVEDGLDKRIELRASSLASDWETFDFKVYTTEEDITGSSSFVLRISGTVNEAYFTDANNTKDVISIRQAQAGISPILFEVDESAGTITFRDPIYTTCVEPEPDPLNPDAPPVCPVVPYLSEPSITLELVELSEVGNLLPASKVESISAIQVTSGEVNTAQLPSIKHEGRINEDLFSLQIPMTTIDSYLYEIANVFQDSDRNKIGDSTTFYDIIQVGDSEADDLLAATANGVWFSSDFGNTWNHRISFDEPVKRIFRSSDDVYFAITGYFVYKSNSSNFSSWEKMSGLDYVKSIRDITEDSTGNIYISTDLGVFRLNEDKPFLEDTWEQLEIFGTTSTDAHGLFFNTFDDRILVGNELGLVQSLDEGKSWFYDATLPANVKVQRFVSEGNFIFALVDDSIYRKLEESSTFEKIADLKSDFARNIAVVNDTIYVTTDLGPRFSAAANIYHDTDIDFLPALSLVNIKGRAVAITSLNVISDKLIIGTDRRLFLLDGSNLWLQYEQLETVVPTIFVNNKERELGVFYNNGGEKQNLIFDEKLSPDDVVTIANKYDVYVAENGGWAEQKFDAKVEIRANNIPFGETTENISLDTGQFTSFQFPEYTDLNANKTTADTYKESSAANITAIGDSGGLDSSALRDLVTNTFRNIEKFLSQLYIEARVVNGETVQLPNIVIDIIQKNKIIDSFGQLVDEEIDLKTTVNATTSAVVFDSPFDKFDELKIDILGVTVKNAGELTHREIEDTLELANSGFPSSLSQVQQVNLVKLGVFNEKQWPEQQTELMSPPVQSEYIVPRGDSWFDTLNSTANYVELITKDDVNLRLTYVTSALFVEETNTVFAGGKGGVLSIDAGTLDINEVDVSLNMSNEFVKSIKRNNDNLYIITDKNIYLSEDLGFVWSTFDRTGLSNNLNSIGFVLNNIVVGAEDGIYYKGSESIEWQKSIDATYPVEIMINPDLLFTVIDNDIHISGDGFTFFKLETNHTFNINDMEKFGASVYIGTDEGLYTDASSFYGSNPRMVLIDVEGVPEDTPINSMSANESFMGAGLDTNKYYLQEGEEFQVFNSNAISTAQKVLAVNDDLWIFSYNLFVVSSLDSSVILSSGVPV
tara:strand:+ start:6518 stop:12211 length:5694 start_codon:yes stop_codon:yes gene_type:complete